MRERERMKKVRYYFNTVYSSFDFRIKRTKSYKPTSIQLECFQYLLMHPFLTTFLKICVDLCEQHDAKESSLQRRKKKRE